MKRNLELVTKNLTTKIFSLFLSILLFVFVNVESAAPVDVDIPIDYRTADEIMVTGEPPAFLHTTLQGPWARFLSRSPDNFVPVLIDLSNAGPGTVRQRIEMSTVPTPPGMEVVSIRPAEIEISLDRKVERQIPVQPDIRGRPDSGFEIADVQSEPPRVAVVGPAMKMQGIDFISTRGIDVEGREESLTVEVDLQPPPPPLRLREKKARVTVDIDEIIVTRSFDDIKVEVDGPPGTRIRPATVSIKLRGTRRVVDMLDRAQVVPYVETLAEQAEGQTRFEKAVKLRVVPEGTQWVGLAPRVEVEVPRKGRRK